VKEHFFVSSITHCCGGALQESISRISEVSGVIVEAPFGIVWGLGFRM
jgi:hypothetical protein